MNRRIECFLTAAQSDSFTDAAKRAFMTVPSLIQHINALEGELGVTLFNRSSKGICLTRAGQSFFKDMQRLCALYEQAVQSARELEKRGDVVIKLGVFHSDTHLVVPLVSRAFSERYPHRQISFYRTSRQNMERDLTEKVIDACFVQKRTGFDAKQILYRPVATDTVVCLVPKAHRLASFPRIHFDDLRGECVLFKAENTSSFHDELRARIEQEGSGITIQTIPDDLVLANLLLTEQGDHAVALCGSLFAAVDDAHVAIPFANDPTIEIGLLSPVSRRENSGAGGAGGATDAVDALYQVACEVLGGAQS